MLVHIDKWYILYPIRMPIFSENMSYLILDQVHKCDKTKLWYTVPYISTTMYANAEPCKSVNIYPGMHANNNYLLRPF